ncbi:MAG: glutamine synthetase family protein [Pseudomonadota bacterium]
MAGASLTEAELTQFLAAAPDVERIELLFPDMNGVLRGKWLPIGSAKKLLAGGVRLPISTYALNIWGEDVDESGLAIRRGDPDGVAWAVAGSLRRAPWSDPPAAQALMTLVDEDGAPCLYDPRQRLAAVVDAFAAKGLTAVVATELEFHLIQPRQGPESPPEPPAGLHGAQVYDLDATDLCGAVLTEIHAACAALEVPADAVIAEFGPGQFEINLKHLPDPLAAADAALMFKRVVRAVARRHGLEATFMAKPYGESPGSGMHAHVSLLDAAGASVFDAKAPGAKVGRGGVAAPLLLAIGGLLASMRPLQAIFAPHRNSYRRFQPDSYAPISPCWGLDHRGVAVRVPETSGPGARLEHRICGADVNPYLAIAAILGGMLYGLEEAVDPGPPVEGDAAAGGAPALHHDWQGAVEEFGGSPIAARVLGEEYVRVYTACRRDEIRQWASLVSNVEYRTYLGKL